MRCQTHGWSHFCGWMTALLLVAAPQLARADVSVMIRPDTTCVAPQQQCTVDLYVDRAGSAFDGYETVILYDPTVLEVVSLAEGDMMIELCYSTWWRDTTDVPGRIFISHVAMCGGLTMTGPGVLSSITFRARTQESESPVTFDYIEFYRAGNVVPSTARDGEIFVRVDCPAVGACCLDSGSCVMTTGTECAVMGGDFLGYEEDCASNPCDVPAACCIMGECQLLLEGPCNNLGGRWHPEWPECEPGICSYQDAPPGSDRSGILLREPAPNPFCNTTIFGYELPEPGPVRIEIFDAAGRRVRVLRDELATADSGLATWSGCDDRGGPVPPGAYFCRLSTRGQSRIQQVILLR